MTEIIGSVQPFGSGITVDPNTYYEFNSGPFTPIAGASSVLVKVQGFITSTSASTVRVDDVTFAPALPEPASALLLALAAVALAAGRKNASDMR